MSTENLFEGAVAPSGGERFDMLLKHRMPLELAQLFALRYPAPAPEAGGLLRVKVRGGLRAILAFGSAEAAIRCARMNRFEPDVVKLLDVFANELKDEVLLVFRTVEEVEIAYDSQSDYDFSVHITAWPIK